MKLKSLAAAVGAVVAPAEAKSMMMHDPMMIRHHVMHLHMTPRMMGHRVMRHMRRM